MRSTVFRAVLGPVLALCLFATASAAPAEIIFLRHAEKPPSGPTLNAKGYERANALPPLFASDPRVLEFGKIVAIFSAAPAKAGSSVRSVETMQPTGKVLGLTLHTAFTKDDLPQLVKAVMGDPAFDGKTVVVCWEHKKIPDILKAFGYATGPTRWDDAVFDRLWILNFTGDKPTRFRDLPEKVLPGDST